MAIEYASYLHAFDAQYPATGDQIPEGDDHIRMIKSALKNTFPGRNGADSRTIVKTVSFTPAITEISAIYHITAEATVYLPLLSGLPEGAYFVFKAVGGAATVIPFSGNTLDCTTLVIAQGSWAILAKQGTVWTTMTVPALTAAAITAALGSTAVQNATHADSATDSTKVAKTGDTMTGNLTISNANPYLALADTTSGDVVVVNYDDGLAGFYKAVGVGTGWKMYVTDNGNIWTPAFGFLTSYFSVIGHTHNYAGVNSNFDWELVRNATIAANATLNVLSNYGYGIYYYTTSGTSGVLITSGNGATLTMSTESISISVNASDILSNIGAGSRTLYLYKLRKTA